jgi:Domain of unknown function (DUF955).
MEIRTRRHDGGPKGWYSCSRKLLSTRRGLTIAEYRSTFAHELAHAHYNDGAIWGRYSQRQEYRADLWAARLLLSESAVRDALIWHNHHRSPAAYDLEVTEHLLNIWLDHHERRSA